MTKPAWDASELARAALSELTEGERVELVADLMVQVQNAHLLAVLRGTIDAHMADLTAQPAASEALLPAGWMVAERVLSDLLELGEAERSRLIVGVLQQIGDLKLIADARNALTDQLNDLIGRQYGIQREGQR